MNANQNGGQAHALTVERESDTTEEEAPVVRPSLKVVAPPVVRPSLASLLAEGGIVSEEQLGYAIAEGMGSGQRLGEFVLRRGWIDHAGLGQLLARQWELPFLADSEVAAEQAVAALLSPADASELQACATAVSEDGSVQVAVAEPTEERFSAVRAALQRDCRFVVVTKETLDRLLAEVFAPTGEVQSSDAQTDSAEEAAEPETDPTLLAELDDTTSHLAAFRERVERVVHRQEQTDRELAECREELLALTSERERERTTVDRLEKELARHQELLSLVKGKLVDATGALEMDVHE